MRCKHASSGCTCLEMIICTAAIAGEQMTCDSCPHNAGCSECVLDPHPDHMTIYCRLWGWKDTECFCPGKEREA